MPLERLKVQVMKLKIATKDALRALHAGLVGLRYPTYKMIISTQDDYRILMCKGVFEEANGQIHLLNYTEMGDPTKKYQAAGYCENTSDDLIFDGLTALVPIEEWSYQAHLLTLEGLSIAIKEFGPLQNPVHILEKIDIGDRLAGRLKLVQPSSAP